MYKYVLALVFVTTNAYASDPDPSLTPQNEDHYNIVQTKITNGTSFNSPEMVRHGGQLKMYYQTGNGIYRADCNTSSCNNGQLVLAKNNFEFLGEPTIVRNNQQYFMFLSGVPNGQNPDEDANRQLYVSTSNINSGTVWSTPQLISSNHHQPGSAIRNGQIYILAVQNTDKNKIDRLSLSTNGGSITNTSLIQVIDSTLYGYYAQPHLRYNSSLDKFQMLVDRVSSTDASTIDYMTSDDGITWNISYGKAVEGQNGIFASQTTTDPNDFEQTYFSGRDSGNNINIYLQDLKLPSENEEIDPSQSGGMTDPGGNLVDNPSADPTTGGQVDTSVPEDDTPPATDPIGNCPSHTGVLRCTPGQRIDFSARVDSNGCFLPPRCVDVNNQGSSSAGSNRPAVGSNSNSTDPSKTGPSSFLNFNINPFKSAEDQLKDLIQSDGFETDSAFDLFSQAQSQGASGFDFLKSLTGGNEQKQEEEAAAESSPQRYDSRSRSSRATRGRTSRSLYSRIQALRNNNKSTSRIDANKKSSQQSDSREINSTSQTTDNRIQAMKSSRETNRYKFYSRRTVTANSRNKTSTSRRQQSQVYSGYKVYSR